MPKTLGTMGLMQASLFPIPDETEARSLKQFLRETKAKILQRLGFTTSRREHKDGTFLLRALIADQMSFSFFETEKSDSELDGPPLGPLSDAEAWAMHENLLLHVMRHLCVDRRVSLATKEAIIEWMMAPLVGVDKVHRYPFSFEACCMAWMADPEEVQAAVLLKLATEKTSLKMMTRK